nr:uncharacterized protein LOC110072698 [Pogona vitticeps]
MSDLRGTRASSPLTQEITALLARIRSMDLPPLDWDEKPTAEDGYIFDDAAIDENVQTVHKSLQFLENSRRVEEEEDQLQESWEEKSLLCEENTRCESPVLGFAQTTWHQPSTHSPGAATSRHEAGFGENPAPMAQAPIRSADGDVQQVPPGEKLNQQQEELQWLHHDFHQVQNLCWSIEKELRLEREKNLELREHNISLQQENVKLHP